MCFWLRLFLSCMSCMCCGFPLVPTRISVLVGAPKANTSQPGIVEAGSVYYCPWPGVSGTCRQIPFDNSSKSSVGHLPFQTRGSKVICLGKRHSLIMFPRVMFSKSKTIPLWCSYFMFYKLNLWVEVSKQPALVAIGGPGCPLTLID